MDTDSQIIKLLDEQTKTLKEIREDLVQFMEKVNAIVERNNSELIK